MHLAERVEGGLPIYAAALQAPGGGFLGAVGVRKGSGTPDGQRKEVFRDECLDDGAVWNCPDEALDFAVQVGRAAIRAQGVLLG